MHAHAISKGEYMVDLHTADSDLQESLDLAKEAQAKLQKIIKEDLPDGVSKDLEPALKRAEEVLASIPKSISKVQELKKEVTANKSGTKIPMDLQLKVTEENSHAVLLYRDAEEVQEKAQSLHQAALDEAARKALVKAEAEREARKAKP